MILKLKFNFIFKMELLVLEKYLFSRSFKFLGLLACVAGGLAIPHNACAQGNYFVTYTHHMEEPGDLDIETSGECGPDPRKR